ncbi:hypothetical protein GF314_10640 [bacterium]|nr:hypothetical protein [bacterium]
MFPDTRALRVRLLIAGALTLVAGTALAFSGGPPDGRTNAPGENTCTQCHGTFPLNSGSGEITLAGFPAEYTPGESYDVTVTLSDPDAARWGFELTLLEDGGTSAGALVVTDAGTQSSGGGGREYLKHNAAGTYPGTTGSASWAFTWQAPDAGTGPVTMYVAGNGANNDGGSGGDRIYATSFAVGELVGTPVGDTPLAVRLLGAAPNPFNPQTRIRFDLPRPVDVRVTVFTADGRRVATLADGPHPAGRQSVTWEGRDHAGRAMGSGTYVYVVEAGGERRLGRLTLLK